MYFFIPDILTKEHFEKYRNNWNKWDCSHFEAKNLKGKKYQYFRSPSPDVQIQHSPTGNFFKIIYFSAVYMKIGMQFLSLKWSFVVRGSQRSPLPKQQQPPLSPSLRSAVSASKLSMPNRNSISPARSHHSRTRSRSPTSLPLKIERAPTPGKNPFGFEF